MRGIYHSHIQYDKYALVRSDINAYLSEGISMKVEQIFPIHFKVPLDIVQLLQSGAPLLQTGVGVGQLKLVPVIK